MHSSHNFNKVFVILLIVSAIGVWFLRDVIQWETAFYAHIKKYPEAYSGNCNILITSPDEIKKAIEINSFIAFRHPSCLSASGPLFLAEQKISSAVLDPILLQRGMVQTAIPISMPPIQHWLHSLLGWYYNTTPLKFYKLTQTATKSCENNKACVAAINPYGKFSSQLSGCDTYDNLQQNPEDFIYSGFFSRKVVLANQLFYIPGKDLDDYYSIQLKKINSRKVMIFCERNLGFECFRVAAILSQKYIVKTCLVANKEYLNHVSQKIDTEATALSPPALLYYKLINQDFFEI